jgi:hypothetical protein
MYGILPRKVHSKVKDSASIINASFFWSHFPVIYNLSVQRR